MNILHLSDLHFGTLANANNWYSQLADDLIHELNCSHLDALIVSGDVVAKSLSREYTAAEKFLESLCREFRLGPDQVIIVPGNHDLNWTLAKRAYKPKRREEYKYAIDGNHVIDRGEFVEVQNPEKYKQRFLNFSTFYQSIIGVPYPLRYEEQAILYHLPQYNLLILGLNSAWQLDHHYTSRTGIHPDALSNALTEIRQNSETYGRYLKFAVWHHPLNGDDRIADIGFLQRLAQAGFCIALHGHIHKSETSLYRYDMNPGGRRIEVICAGTFGSPTREWVPGYPLQYNLLRLEDRRLGLVVETRCRKEPNGAWQPDAIWTQGPGQDPLPRYEIKVPETLILGAPREETKPKTNICLPDLRELFNNLQSEKSLPQQFSYIFETLVKVLEMTLQLFIVSTVRSYEREIVDEPPEYSKKAKPIKRIISEKFTSPSLTTLYELARSCYHLVNEKAPDELKTMKECLGKTFILGAIGKLLDDLEKILPPDSTKPRIIKKAQVGKRLLDYVIPEISKYATKIERLRSAVESNYGELDLDINVWQKALEMLIDTVTPIVSQVFVLESLEQVDTTSGNYIVRVRTYANGVVDVSQKIIPVEELEEYESNTSALVMNRQGSQIFIGTFPFLVIKDDKLYYYKRTRAAGYEYHSICDSCAHVVQTKRKFNHSVFKTGGKGAQQSLFWTEVLPSDNEKSGIKANIPTEGPVEFIGRKKQITRIKEEIIEIPNQNGIVFGLGGVGKTALMIRLSHELYEEENREKALFDNMVWITAKRNYYNPTSDFVETRQPQFESLDAVISTILSFFEFSDLEEYGFEDKKGFLLELLTENRVLLVLDNFETIPEGEADAIIRFFEVEIKRSLRKKPENFKVIITSRKQIPGGLHQVELTGLSLRESKQLMKSLYKQYTGPSPDLSDEQKEMLHQATFGTPILIKHCFGQIYEYNKPFDAVIRNLSTIPNKAVEFSFEEILKLLKSDDCQLEMILLLELINCPLLIRQIVDILARDEYEIEIRIPPLVNYQCVRRINQGRQEKYAINDEIRILTRRLVQENAGLAQNIRQKITRNFTVEKQMDYSTEELGILSIFNSYLSEKDYLGAERFIKDELKENPQLILLKFHYAKFLKEQKREIEEAIQILEDIREPGNNHPSILRLLVSCYMSLDVPNYDRASVYVQQIESVPVEDEDLRLQVAEFYVRWSISIKMNRDISPDPIEEMLRQQRYKELASKALVILNQIKHKTHEVYYLLAQSYFNLWDYQNALTMINEAIRLCQEDPSYYQSYTYLQKLILKQQAKYSGR